MKITPSAAHAWAVRSQLDAQAKADMLNRLLGQTHWKPIYLSAWLWAVGHSEPNGEVTYLHRDT